MTQTSKRPKAAPNRAKANMTNVENRAKATPDKAGKVMTTGQIRDEAAKVNIHFGYARVSTDDQELHLQIDALTKAGCDQIFQEVVSSSKQRPQLEECLRAMRKGDTLTVWRLDRLGRSLIELVKIISDLQDKGITFSSLCEHIDTGSATGKFTFQLFAALAEFERNIIKERTMAGLAAARARGRKGGRKPKITEASEEPDDPGIERIRVEPTLPKAYPPSEIARISYLALMRLADDDVEIEHVTGDDGISRLSLTFRAIRDDLEATS